MNNELVTSFIQHLEERRSIYFRLYNVLYIVSLDQEKLSIHQDGLSVSYTYSSVEDLFYQYFVYGLPLIETINDIKIV